MKIRRVTRKRCDSLDSKTGYEGKLLGKGALTVASLESEGRLESNGAALAAASAAEGKVFSHKPARTRSPSSESDQKGKHERRKAARPNNSSRSGV